MFDKKIKDNIKESDILTDWDGVVINGQGVYRQLFAYFLSLNDYGRMNFTGELVKNYIDYKKEGDISAFYSMFAGCPVKVIDKTVGKNRQNERWNDLIDKLKLKKPGIVSRNSFRIISRDLDSGRFDKNDFKIKIVAANEPEIVNDVYTGEVNLIVTNDTLIDFVREKDYIHGKDEKRILESFGDSGIHIIDVGHGLYIGTKQKYFIKSPLKSRNAYK